MVDPRIITELAIILIFFCIWRVQRDDRALRQRDVGAHYHLGSKDTVWLQCHLFLDLSMVTEQRLMDLRPRSHLNTFPQVGPVQHHVITNAAARTNDTVGDRAVAANDSARAQEYILLQDAAMAQADLGPSVDVVPGMSAALSGAVSEVCLWGERVDPSADDIGTDSRVHVQVGDPGTVFPSCYMHVDLVP